MDTTDSRKIILMAGPKGGVGKTTIALNTAIALAEKGVRVLLVDCDFSLSSASLLYGEDYHVPISDVDYSGDFPLNMLRNIIKDVDVIPAPFFRPDMDLLLGEYVANLVERLPNIKGYYMIILDSAPGYSSEHIALLGVADSTVLISTPEPVSISSTYSFLKMASEKDGLGRVHLLVNQVATTGEGMSVFERFAVAVSYFLEKQIYDMGSIPDDENVGIASREETPLVLRFPTTVAAKAIDRFADQLRRKAA